MRLYDYSASANCYKARLLLAQLDRPYERCHGRYLQESNAILWYLAEGTEFLPDDPFERAHVLKWLILEQTDVMPGIGGLRFRLLTGRWSPEQPEAKRRPSTSKNSPRSPRGCDESRNSRVS